jgi:hypothetical protein
MSRQKAIRAFLFYPRFLLLKIILPLRIIMVRIPQNLRIVIHVAQIRCIGSFIECDVVFGNDPAKIDPA